MSAKITREVLDSYLDCRRKAFFKSLGETGLVHDFEKLQREITAVVKQGVTEKIATDIRSQNEYLGVVLTPEILKSGASYLLDATLSTKELNLRFDGVKLVSGTPGVVRSHYIPILFLPQRNVRKKQKLLLALYAHLLGAHQGSKVDSGLLFYGRACRSMTVRLGKQLLDASRAFGELQQLLERDELPPVLLNAHCSVCEFQQRCREQAEKEDNISLLSGLAEKQVRAYSRKGILTVTQLAHTFRPRRKGKRAGLVKRRYHELQAMAVRDSAVYVLGTPELPSRPVNIYVDLETDSETHIPYLIGAIVDTGKSQQTYSFWADNPGDESKICDAFLDMVMTHEDAALFAYGAHEKKCFTKMRPGLKPKRRIDDVIERLVNVLSVIYSHIYFPVYSNGLKDVGRHLGCSWSEPNASGLQCFAWRMKWDATHDPMWKEKIVAYNLEDCSALKTVTEFAKGIGQKVKLPPEQCSGDGQNITWVHDLDTLVQPKRWGKVDFFHSDFEEVNKCAYFDYQRERVHARTSTTIRRDVVASRKRHTKHLNTRLRVTDQIVIKSNTCPNCHGKNLVRGLKRKDMVNPPPQLRSPHVKRALDLVVTLSSIKRKVIQCRSSIHKCQDCDEVFVPWRYKRFAKHFHGLMSWIMYQHIVHMISMRRIVEMLREFFGIHVLDAEVVQIKSLMAQYYKSTYKKLLRQMLSGGVLHIDETEVKLREQKGYVWVFANIEQVVYIYRPTREAGFLKGMLSGFKGVLVSDFFAAYDSLDCPQQKCLIHLMRDMNQELLVNPFDTDLQAVTRPFGALLRSIVESIDRYGLKRRHLRKHCREVKRFFTGLEEKTFHSDAAKDLQKRLIKYRSKLFTFMDYSGVSWNNNSAENAIKYFAYYRHDHKGQLTEQGIADYLVLLSICQSCRCRGVSFLKFMLSGQRDLEASLRKRRRKSIVEVYPKGFLPLSDRWNKSRRSQEEVDSARESTSSNRIGH